MPANASELPFLSCLLCFQSLYSALFVGRVTISESNLHLWRAVVDGPKDTPYEGGKFKFSIVFGHDYPMSAPKVCVMLLLYRSCIYEVTRNCSVEHDCCCS